MHADLNSSAGYKEDRANLPGDDWFTFIVSCFLTCHFQVQPSLSSIGVCVASMSEVGVFVCSLCEFADAD